MNITSLNYLFFVALVAGIYYVLPRRAQNIWLLLASYLFCITWSWQFALVLVVLTVVNFHLAQKLHQDSHKSKAWLWLGIGFNLLALVYFRSANFFVPELMNLLAGFGLQYGAGSLQILLPIGLSYYVLENISYLVDVYRRQFVPADDFVDFALYLAYFPKLIAGPIERARSFLPKLAERRVVDNAILARSFTLIMIGLTRKLLIADILTAAIPWDIFETPEHFGGPELWGWLLVYAFALYNDFAGYTNIVRGVSGFFGIELSPNFQQPFFARSFTEFWNQWHITLSHWLRDYIYFPLTRSLLRRNPGRRNVPNLVIPPIATMLVSGLWHGFSPHMLLWGALHGCYQIFERLPSLWRPIVPPQQRPLWQQGLAMGIVFVLVLLAWVPFRMEIPIALQYWYGLLDWSNWTLHYRRLILVAPFMLIALAIDIVQRYAEDEVVFLRWPRLAQASLLALSLFFTFIISQAEQSEPFIYQGF